MLKQQRVAIGHRRIARRSMQGLSIVELLIGVAIGLFILAGASAMFVTNVTNSRKILLEARLNQELRSTMDLITRDLRRGAYWANAINGTSTVGTSATAQANPYAAITLGTNEVVYAYSRDATENDALDAATEQFGIRLNGGQMQMQIGGNWQTLTNAAVVSITSFTITPRVTAIDIRAACAKTCVGTSCPTITVRSYNVVLTGRLVSDTSVSRTLQSQVRVRNDSTAGVCPA
jgi:prepilin peptidase dependent protein B